MRTEHPPGEENEKTENRRKLLYGLFAKLLRPVSTNAKASVLNMQSKFVLMEDYLSLTPGNRTRN